MNIEKLIAECEALLANDPLNNTLLRVFLTRCVEALRQEEQTRIAALKVLSDRAPLFGPTSDGAALIGRVANILSFGPSGMPSLTLEEIRQESVTVSE